jgi:copper chaperone NosL
MTKRQSVILVVLAVFLQLNTGMIVMAQSDIDDHRECAGCGMDRKAYGYSRMLIQYEDGTEVGVCSLHCAVEELDAHGSRKVKAIFVADRDTRTLIAADKAIWVMGGSKRGVMTKQPKWAFQTRAAAEAFIGSYGGKLVSWEEALAAARQDMSQERP